MTNAFSVGAVASWLGWPRGTDLSPLERLAEIGEPAEPFVPPVGDELRALMERLAVPPHARDEIESSVPAASSHPEAWWVLERLFNELTRPDGRAPPWPAPFVTEDALTHHFHLFVFLAAVGHVLRAHGARGIAPDVTWATLYDVGLQVANYEVRTGRPGFDAAFWVWPHFRAEVFTLGRLQFDRDGRGVDVPALGVHIPALGPLLPEACDDSFARARGFFRRHFPEVVYRVASCQSWLMDDQLASYLDAGSNIIAFQRRFELDGSWSRTGDEDVIRFVFGRLPASLDELPQQTSVQRAIVRHLKDGGHWLIRRGRLEL